MFLSKNIYKHMFVPTNLSYLQSNYIINTCATNIYIYMCVCVCVCVRFLFY